MKKILALILAMLMLMSVLSACGGTETEEPAAAEAPAAETAEEAVVPVAENETAETVTGVSDETLYVVAREEPDHLCALYGTNSETGGILSLAMYDYLLYLNNETGEFEKSVATDYEWIDDTHIRIKIRDDVVAYDGTTITANDIMYGLELGLAGNNVTSYIMVDPDECYVEDDYTLVLGTTEAYPTIENLMSTSGFLPIIDESSVEAVGGWDVAYRQAKISTGKYFLDEWVDGEYIRLVRNDDHWDQENLPYYKYIEVSFVSDAATRAMALQSGEADVAMSLTAAQDEALGSDSVMWYGFGDASKCIWMNCSEGPLADERVREAIFWLIDNDAIIALCTNGVATPTETQFSTKSFYYAEPPAGYERKVDVEKAISLLEEAGYGDGVTIKSFGLQSDQATLELIQSMLSAANISLEIELVEPAAGFSKMGSGDYELYLGASYGFDPVRVMNRVDGRIAPAQAGGGAVYNSDELNALIDIARASTDDAERMQAYADVQHFIIDKTLCIGLYMDCVRFGVNNDIGGAVYDGNGYLYLTGLRPTA